MNQGDLIFMSAIGSGWKAGLWDLKKGMKLKCHLPPQKSHRNI